MSDRLSARVVVEVAGDDLLQPSSLLGNRLVHAPSQFLFDGLQLFPHAVRRDFRLIWNLPRRVLLRIKVKPRKVKVATASLSTGQNKRSDDRASLP